MYADKLGAKIAGSAACRLANKAALTFASSMPSPHIKVETNIARPIAQTNPLAWVDWCGAQHGDGRLIGRPRLGLFAVQRRRHLSALIHHDAYQQLAQREPAERVESNDGQDLFGDRICRPYGLCAGILEIHPDPGARNRLEAVGTVIHTVCIDLGMSAGFGILDCFRHRRAAAPSACACLLSSTVVGDLVRARLGSFCFSFLFRT